MSKNNLCKILYKNGPLTFPSKMHKNVPLQLAEVDTLHMITSCVSRY